MRNYGTAFARDACIKVTKEPSERPQREDAAMNLVLKCARFFVLLASVIALAIPAFAQGDSGARPSQPGSVIIFAKFINTPAVSVNGNTMPRTEIEVGAVCPDGFTCTEHQTVKVRF